MNKIEMLIFDVLNNCKDELSGERLLNDADLSERIAEEILSFQETEALQNKESEEKKNQRLDNN